jgi:hypothetical protein
MAIDRKEVEGIAAGEGCLSQLSSTGSLVLDLLLLLGLEGETVMQGTRDRSSTGADALAVALTPGAALE